MVLNNVKEIVFILSYYVLFPRVINEELIPYTNQQVRPNVKPVISGEEKGLNEMEKGTGSKWPTGSIPYLFDVKSYDFLVGYKIRMNMNVLESSSCIHFAPMHGPPHKKSDEAWIHITNPKKQRECTHEVQELGNGENVLVLGYDCLAEVEILHSLLHAIGFHDEVTHPYRDKYIRVQWTNIQPRYRELYNIRAPTKPDILVEYDPLSVMQFGDHDFSVNGQATTEPLLSGMIIRPSKRLSQLDHLKLNLYFGHLCNKREVKQLLQTCKNTLHEERGQGKVDKFKNIDSIDSNDLSDDKDSMTESSEDDVLSGLKDKDSEGESSEDDVLNGLKDKDSKGESSEDNVLSILIDKVSKKESYEDDEASDLKDKDSKEESSEYDVPRGLKDKDSREKTSRDDVPRGLKDKDSKEKSSGDDVQRGLKDKGSKDYSDEDDVASALKDKDSKKTLGKDDVPSGLKYEDSKKKLSKDDVSNDLKDKDSKENSSEDYAA